MVDVIKRRTTGVSTDTGELVKIDMQNISAPTWGTGIPDTTAVTAPAALTLTVAPTGGVTPYAIQWFKDGNAIAGATNLTYSKTPTTTADSGTYKVVAQDSFGNILVDQTVVTVS